MNEYAVIPDIYHTVWHVVDKYISKEQISVGIHHHFKLLSKSPTSCLSLKVNGDTF